MREKTFMRENIQVVRGRERERKKDGGRGRGREREREREHLIHCKRLGDTKKLANAFETFGIVRLQKKERGKKKKTEKASKIERKKERDK